MALQGNSEQEQRELQTLLREVLAGRLNRRQMMGRAAALGLSAASLHALSAAAAPARPGGVVRPAAQDEEPRSGGILRVGLLGEPANLDPHTESLTAKFHVTEHIYEGLVRERPDLTMEPVLIEELPGISEDGLTYTFTLRSGVRFHNGRELVAEDVKYSFERILDPATASGSTALLVSLDTIETPDERTVVMTLKNPDASFLSALSGKAAAIVAREVVEDTGLTGNAVGTGPFTFVEYVPNTRIILEKNEDYWDTGLPYLDGIEMLPIPDDTQRTNAMLTSEVDFIEYAPLRDIPILEAEENLVLAGDTNTNIRFIAVNFDRPPLDDIRVRRAIALALDRDEIIQPAVYGYGIATEVIFPPDYWAYVDVEPAGRDVEQARALLAEAGYEDGLELEILSWQQYAFLFDAAYVVQAQLADIGITADVVLEENAVFIQRLLETKDFDISVTGTSAYVDPNAIYDRNFRTGASGNGMNYSNPRVDELILEGVAVTDQERRAEIYTELQQILLEDLPWINLYIANQFEAMTSEVRGYTHIPTGTNHAFRETWLDQ